MSNIILGSGIVGLLARHILGESYKVIPFKRSRYYSHDIPIADNEIAASDGARDVLRSLDLPIKSRFFPVAVSYAGQLLFNKLTWAHLISDRLYGEHPFAARLLGQEISSYSVSAKQLYEVLLSKYSEDIHMNANTEVISIGHDKIKTSSGEIGYSNIVSTIPLDALLQLVGIGCSLESHDYHVFLLATDAFDLEGAKRCFIGDLSIPFWKVNVIDKEIYQFFANGYTKNAEIVFAMLTQGRYKVLADTVIPGAFPMGTPPVEVYNKLGKMGITCVGSNARWDYFCDIATSIKMLLKS